VYQMSTAYLLWLLSGFGVLGFHRFYLGRIGTGLIWLFTGGLFGFGAMIYLFYIPSMVRQENLGIRYRRVLFADEEERPLTRPKVPARESLERIILRTARKNKGVVTPAEVALEGDIPIEEARQALEKLVAGGHAEMRIRKTGVIAYVIPEFLEGGGGEFADL
jgi:TM2 domain-containing membrane protein YozV